MKANNNRNRKQIEMSYLLTEIALDMLGYKFYDINGSYRITDFQTKNKSTDANEIPLEDLIFPKDSSEMLNSTNSDDCMEISELPTPNICINQDQMVVLNIKESVDKEVENLREEIYHNKTKFIEENIKVIRKRDKTSKITPKDLLKPYNERERKNIRAEAEMLSEFLKCVEKRLEEANADLLNSHKRYKLDEYL